MVSQVGLASGHFASEPAWYRCLHVCTMPAFVLACGHSVAHVSPSGLVGSQGMSPGSTLATFVALLAAL